MGQTRMIRGLDLAYGLPLRTPGVKYKVGGGGVLSGKVGTGMYDPERVLFRPLSFTNGTFFILKLV